MKKMMLWAALAASMLSAPVAAQRRWTERVAHHDLRLDRAADVERLNRRILRAAQAACGSAPDFDVRGRNDVRRCRVRTVASVADQRDRAIAAAQATALAARSR